MASAAVSKTTQPSARFIRFQRVTTKKKTSLCGDINIFSALKYSEMLAQASRVDTAVVTFFGARRQAAVFLGPIAWREC